MSHVSVLPALALEELFTHRPDGKANYEAWQTKDTVCLKNFYIWGFPGRFDAKEKLQELLEDRGLVFPLNEWNFYFQIHEGRLWLRYQFIIGSRHVCNLKQEELPCTA